MSRIAILVLAVGLAGCAVFPQSAEQVKPAGSNTSIPANSSGMLLGGQPRLPTQRILVGKAELSVEVANTDEARTEGLSGRKQLAPGEGMLFLFDSPGTYEFWMKDMLFPLDFIWVNGNSVVQVDSNIPAPSVESPKPAKVRASKAVNAVIEVPAGWVKENNILVGNKVAPALNSTWFRVDKRGGEVYPM